MTQAYSNPDREDDPHALPDIEVFQITAVEVAATMDDDIWEFMRRPEFCFAAMNSRDRERMYDAMVEELGIEGGWFYWYCFPGCLPDSEPVGPFKSHAEALKSAREDAAE